MPAKIFAGEARDNGCGRPPVGGEASAKCRPRGTPHRAVRAVRKASASSWSTSMSSMRESSWISATASCRRNDRSSAQRSPDNDFLPDRTLPGAPSRVKAETGLYRRIGMSHLIHALGTHAFAPSPTGELDRREHVGRPATAVLLLTPISSCDGGISVKKQRLKKASSNRSCACARPWSSLAVICAARKTLHTRRRSLRSAVGRSATREAIAPDPAL